MFVMLLLMVIFFFRGVYKSSTKTFFGEFIVQLYTVYNYKRIWRSCTNLTHYTYTVHAEILIYNHIFMLSINLCILNDRCIGCTLILIACHPHFNTIMNSTRTSHTDKGCAIERRAETCLM